LTINEKASHLGQLTIENAKIDFLTGLKSAERAAVLAVAGSRYLDCLSQKLVKHTFDAATSTERHTLFKSLNPQDKAFYLKLLSTSQWLGIMKPMNVEKRMEIVAKMDHRDREKAFKAGVMNKNMGFTVGAKPAPGDKEDEEEATRLASEKIPESSTRFNMMKEAHRCTLITSY